jgi:hypothetical protein
MKIDQLKIWMVLLKNILDLDPLSIGVKIMTKDDLFEAEQNQAFKLFQNVISSFYITTGHLGSN